MGNYIADRAELNDQIAQHKAVFDTVMERLEIAESYTKQNPLSDIGAKIDYDKDAEMEKYKSEEKAILNFWSEMAQADNEAMKNFQTASEGFVTMFSKLDTLTREIRKVNGNQNPFSSKILQDLILKDGQLLASVLEKLEKGQFMSSSEREYLYFYLQEEYLDEEKIEAIESIIDMIEAGDEEGLMKRLNEHVLSSDESLALEMAMFQAYLFRGNRTLNEHVGGPDNIRDYNIARAYSELLENYHSGLYEASQFPDAKYHEWERKVSKLDIKPPKRGSYFYEIETGLRLENMNLPAFSYEYRVSYYIDESATSHFLKHEGDKAKQKYKNFPKDFWLKELTSDVVGLIDNGTQVLNVADKFIRYEEGLKELENELTSLEIQAAADKLEMELIISERPFNSLFSNQSVIEVNFIPTEATYDIIERLEGVRPQIEKSLPYPEEAIDQQDWLKVSEFLLYYEDDISKISPGLNNYISNGTNE
ncbi:hypothetical protein HXA31_17995 [Salipaludibacillus agaradhaerens]|uniref:LXG domain-containing protein n=1 Tax=Salipaludibacillus agaradhaerens TaxID=76935 RepID=A0A9Q4B4H8_SALAG|nr:hypothetical protein [Salipaludibacillus agaradhaerens]MCR6098141.1 hypothetical protein [Salipaludibacillus agaradhaerens]MCR6116229.1 hypothetical protein [Salipaludibacillus agaradhaerens]